MVLGGCGNGADGAPAVQLNGGSSTGQRKQPRGPPVFWQGNGTANRNGSDNHDASATGSQRSWKEMPHEELRISRSFWMYASLELLFYRNGM